MFKFYLIPVAWKQISNLASVTLPYPNSFSLRKRGKKGTKRMKDRGTENCVFNCDYKCQHVTQYLIEVFTVDHRTECRKTIFKTSTSLEDFPL